MVVSHFFIHLSVQKYALAALKMMDLTSLSEDDTDKTIIKLCKDARTKYGNVAAVCVYSKFVKLAKKELVGTGINVATVVNFPDGSRRDRFERYSESLD